MTRTSRLALSSALLAAVLTPAAIAIAQPGTDPPGTPTSPIDEGGAPPPNEGPDGEAPPPQEDAGPTEPPDGGAEPVEAGAGGGSKETGFQLGVRVGAGIPFGKMFDAPGAKDLGETVPLQIPTWIDFGYRVIPALYVGLYAAAGFPVIKDCTGCTGSDFRLGLNAHYHILPMKKIDPWVGLGIGYEMLGLKQKNGTESNLLAHGFELFNLQAGVDFKILRDMLRVGPFANFSLNHFSTVTFETGGRKTELLEQPGVSSSLHGWMMLGVRMTNLPAR